MNTSFWVKTTLFSLLLTLLPLLGINIQADQAQPQVPDDIMPTDPGRFASPGNNAVYEVMPILFVPADVSPVPYGLNYIDRHMRNIQYWYAEQLNGRTFTLQPAQLIIGEEPRTFYFDNCYPPVNPSSCSWGYRMWDRIFTELDNRGFDLQPQIVQGVFFQGEGMGTALGGSQRFLVGFQPDNMFPDCLEPGCAHQVSLGGAGHELGHALGLPHPDGDPLWGDSLMGTGFYGFPQCTFINTLANPEYDKLTASPFINAIWPLANPGFEGCLAGWSVVEGTPVCTQAGRFSGMKALQVAGSSRLRMSQSFAVNAGLDLDFSGWVRVDTIPAGRELKIVLKVFDPDMTLLLNQTLAQVTSVTYEWTRIAAPIDMPATAAKATLLITTNGGGVVAMIDDLSLAPSILPATPLIATVFDGDAVDTNRPTLRWSPVAEATSFEVQVAADPFFDTVLAHGSTSTYEYQMPVSLPYGKYSFWRVRAINAAGVGEWSPAWSVIPLRPEKFLNDEFEQNALNTVWTFVREDSSRWHIGGLPVRRWHGYFTIDMQPGDLESSNNARNLLLRPMPPDDFAVETLVNFFPPLNANYHQGGLVIYKDDNNYIKLAHVYRNGWRLELEAEVNGVLVQRSGVWLVDDSRLRIERRGTRYAAYYSTTGVGWKALGQPVGVKWPDAKMGLVAYSGLATPQYPTAAFNWIRVTSPCHQVVAVVQPSGAGTVTEAGAACDVSEYRPGTPLRLAAIPIPGFRFTHWSGSVTGSTNPIEVQLGGPLDVVAHFQPSDPYEPNDSADSATPIAYGDTLLAEIAAHDDVDPYDDQDYFSFEGAAGMTRVKVTLPVGSDLAPYVCLMTGGETIIACDDLYPDGVDIAQLLPAGESYLIRVEGNCYEGGMGCNGPYQLELSLTNGPPVAVNDRYGTATGQTLAVDAARGVLANDSDPDGDDLTAVLDTGPQHGQLALSSDGSFIYTPDQGHQGEDSFTYRASDGTTASEPATVTIAVQPVAAYLPVALR